MAPHPLEDRPRRIVVPGPRALLALALALVLLALPAAASAQDACVPPRTLGVAFALDDSGSMTDSDPSELRIEATRAGIDQMPDSSIVAVSSFDTYARSEVDPTALTAANREQLKDEVWGSASGNTDYELGFQQAKEQLDAMPTADKKALVFLSDGVPTESYSTDRALAAEGIPIFTIGFGDAPPSVLAGISARSGGQAFVVRSVGEAQAVFARIVSTLICDAQKYTASVALTPGETKNVPFTVEPSFREFRALAAWEYGDVTVRVQRPDGTLLAPGALLGGEAFVERPTYASISGVNPAAGAWQVLLTASADNIDDVDVSIDVWRRTGFDPPDPPVLVTPAPAVTTDENVVFSWTGARGATSYDLYIDGTAVRTGLTDTSTTWSAIALGGTWEWYVVAHNAYGQTPSEHRVVTIQGETVMAIGDSVAAGFGLQPALNRVDILAICKFTDMPTGLCDQTSVAWPTRVSEGIAKREKVRFQNLAVSGSRPSQWLRNEPKTGKQNDLRPQLDTMVAFKPSIILMTLGANELLGNPACLASSSCISNSTGTVRRDMQELFTHLTTVTHARIYVTAYYAINKDVMGAIPAINNALLAAASAQGVPPGRVFIVAPPDFIGHQCGDKHPWLTNKDVVCVHPNETGHQKIADKVLSAITKGGGTASKNAGAVSKLEVASWAAQSAGRVAIEVSALGVTGPVAGVFKFVRKATGSELLASASAAKTRTVTIRTTLTFRNGVANARLKLPAKVRGASTRMYLRLGARSRCVKAKGSRCRSHVRAKPTRMVLLGEVGSR